MNYRNLLNGLLAQVESLLRTVGMPRTLAEAGVDEKAFQDGLPALARAAFAYPSVRTNPRMPLLQEITRLLELGYYGEERASG